MKGFTAEDFYAHKNENELALKTTISKVASIKDLSNIVIRRVSNTKSAIAATNTRMELATDSGVAVVYEISYVVTDYQGSPDSGEHAIVSNIKTSVKTGSFTSILNTNAQSGTALATAAASPTAPIIISPVVVTYAAAPTTQPTPKLTNFIAKDSMIDTTLSVGAIAGIVISLFCILVMIAVAVISFSFICIFGLTYSI